MRAVQAVAVFKVPAVTSQRDPRVAQVVELRYFAGLDVAETAQVLGVSEPTVERDWREARTFLHDQLA